METPAISIHGGELGDDGEGLTLGDRFVIFILVK